MGIKKCPIIKTEDSVALKKFCSFLMKFQSITSVINSNALNTLDTLSSLLVNLTENMKDRWNRLPSNLRRH